MKSNELFRLLRKHGWEKVRQAGSHVTLEHPDNRASITVPDQGSKEVKKGLLKAILKRAGIKTTKR